MRINLVLRGGFLLCLHAIKAEIAVPIIKAMATIQAENIIMMYGKKTRPTPNGIINENTRIMNISILATTILTVNVCCIVGECLLITKKISKAIIITMGRINNLSILFSISLFIA